jgi:transposase
MRQTDDLSKSLTPFVQSNTLVAVIELSLSSWLVAGVVPGITRQPLKKLGADEAELLRLLQRWRDEAAKSGCAIERVVVAYEAGRDGFWLARWLRVRGVEAYIIHPASIAVSREHRRAKTDRLDTELLMRAFLGWLRGEKRHCSMVAIPTVEEEDARRPNRERGNLVTEQTRIVNQIKAVLTRFGIRTSADAAQGRGTARRSAYSGRGTFAGKHPRGAAPLPRAARRRARTDPCDRAEPPGQARNDPRERPARDSTSHCARPRRRC